MSVPITGDAKPAPKRHVAGVLVASPTREIVVSGVGLGAVRSNASGTAYCWGRARLAGRRLDFGEEMEEFTLLAVGKRVGDDGPFACVKRRQEFVEDALGIAGDGD